MGDIELEKGLEEFERGMKIIAELKDYLATVENKVEIIKQKFDHTESKD